MMLVLRSALFNVWVYVVMAVIGIGLAPVGLWSRAGSYWITRFYSRHMFWVMRHLLGIEVEVRGPVPTEPCLLVCKHQSFADMMILQCALPAAKFIIKQELRFAPFLGWYAMRMGVVPVHRGKGGKALASMMKGVRELQAKGPGQIVIFAQGTRVPPGVEKPWKIGAWRLHNAFPNMPCIPVALNTGLFWGKTDFLRPAGTMVVEFLDPVEPGLPAEDFLQTVETRIETACSALYVEAEAKGEGMDWRAAAARKA